MCVYSAGKKIDASRIFLVYVCTQISIDESHHNKLRLHSNEQFMWRVEEGTHLVKGNLESSADHLKTISLF